MIDFLTNGGPLWVGMGLLAAGIVWIIVKFAIIDRRKLKGIGSALRQDADAWNAANPSMGYAKLPGPDFGDVTRPQSVVTTPRAYVEPRTYRVLVQIPGGELDISQHVVSIVIPDEIAQMIDQLQATMVYPSSGASTAPEGAREAGTTAGAENHDDSVRGQA